MFVCGIGWCVVEIGYVVEWGGCVVGNGYWYFLFSVVL